jgi:hypothetical protein
VAARGGLSTTLPPAAYHLGVPITSIGPACARRGCSFPLWKDTLCNRCWRLATMFGKDPLLFAYQPLDGYRDERDAVELPWEALTGMLADRPQRET